MGVIRKTMSMSTLGLVDYRSDKERTARYARQTRNAVREQNRLLTEQANGPRQISRPAPGLIRNTAEAKPAVRKATIVSVWLLATVFGGALAATLVGIPVTLGLLAAAFLFQRKVTDARHALEATAARQADVDWRNGTERMADRFDQLGEPDMAQGQRDLLDT